MKLALDMYEDSVQYLAGSVLNPEDLPRTKIAKAVSCVVLTNKKSKTNFEDQRNILNALSIKKFVYSENKGTQFDDNHNMPIILQLIKPESKNLYYKSLNINSPRDQLIIVEEIKMNLLAKSCFAPGLISMISNLITSHGDEDVELEQTWTQEYNEGMGHEIYREEITQEVFGNIFRFCDIVELGFTEFNAVVFALEIQERHTSPARSILRLNPHSFELTDWD